jgi:hypothetical protein
LTVKSQARVKDDEDSVELSNDEVLTSSNLDCGTIGNGLYVEDCSLLWWLDSVGDEKFVA